MTNFVIYDPTTGNIKLSCTVIGAPEEEAMYQKLQNVIATSQRIDPSKYVVNLTTKQVVQGTPKS